MQHKKLTKADIAGMEAIIRSSPDETMLQLPTWLIRGYIMYIQQKHTQ